MKRGVRRVKAAENAENKAKPGRIRIYYLDILPGCFELIFVLIAVAGRLRDHQKAGRGGGWVADAVAGTGGHVNAAACGNNGAAAIDFHHDFAGNDIEKLLRFFVVVHDLGAAGGDEFFDNRKIVGLNQAPGVAIGAPAVVFGVGAADGCGLGGGFGHSFVSLHSECIVCE